MKQIQFTSFGQPSIVARCVDVADVGEPAAWEVVVRIEAFPINVADLAMLAGRYGSLPKPPATIGMEAVGIIEKCGTSVTSLNEGDRVIILANNNWAERRKVAAATVHRVPADADPIQLSMLKVNPTTAYLMLNRFEKLERGDWIIQNAPLGSVGQSVIQLAKACGLRTLNIVRSIDAKADVIQLGGDVAVVDGNDLHSQVKSAVGHEPVRIAFDAVAGNGTDRLASCLAEHATVINYGMLSNEHCAIAPEHTIFRNITLRGFWLSKLLNRLNQDERTELYDTLSDKISSGSLTMSVDSCFPITKIGDALRRAEQGGRSGKVIVTPF